MLKKTTCAIVAATLTTSLVPSTAFALGSTASQSVYNGLNIPANTRQQAPARLDITEPGTYVLTGNMRGTVRVDTGEGDVTLIMAGATIDGNGGPAIEAISAGSLHVQMPAGYTNRLMSDGANGGRATMYSSVDTFFDGPGQMTVVGDQQPAFMADNATMSFRDGSFEVISGGFGMMTGTGERPGQISMEGGNFAFRVGEGTVDPNATFNYDFGFIQDLGFTQEFAYDNFARDNAWSNQQPGQQMGQGQQAQQPSQQPGQQMQQPGQNQQMGQPGQQMGQQPTQQAGQPDQQQGQSGQPRQPPVQGQQSGQQQPNQGQQPSQESSQNQQQGQQPNQGQQSGQQQGQRPGQFGQGQQPGQPGGPTQQGSVLEGTTDEMGEIVQGTTTNSAADLEADLENAVRFDVTEDGTVKISESGTYIVTGYNEDGSITVTKGTTGVVLVLDNLDLTSTSGATLSINKEAEVKVIVSGDVTLTDDENPEDENSTDEAVADAFDGAAIKAKANSNVYITGDGNLTIEGNAKNGIKGGDDSSIIIDGDLNIDIDAANDGINTNYDLTIVSGTVTIDAADDAMHADHILTIGDETSGDGPTVDINSSTEGIEATVVNIYGGDINVTSTDDAINAANKDGAYEGELDYSVNILGGDVDINSGGDGIDSNGNVNLVDGTVQIDSAATGGEAGIDYDGDLFVSDDFQLNNNSGVSGPDNMGGMPGGMGGQFGGQPTGQMPSGGQQQMGGMPGGEQGGQFGGGQQQMGGQPGGQQSQGQMQQGGQFGQRGPQMRF